VLLVEPNPLTQGVLKAALADEVSTLDIAGSAQEAASALGTGRFDVLLIEGKALSAGNADAPQTLRNLAGSAAGAQVMVLWAGVAEDLPDLQQAGADLVLLKPIGTADLVRALKTLRSPGGQEVPPLDAASLAGAAE
jgi:CheY-like chemotaxis protein